MIEYKLQEGLKNSNISESDITFTIINSEIMGLKNKIANDKDDEESCHSRRQMAMSYSRRIMPGTFKSKHSKRTNLLNENEGKSGNLADNMILSHLSLKRKEADIERFDKIFEYFNKRWVNVKKSHGINK